MDKITLCGDNCFYCPRFNAQTDEELRECAQLWFSVGWSNSVVSNDEMRCSGCDSHKKCTYEIVNCIKEKGVEKCNECKCFPCEKINKMHERSKLYKEICKDKCTAEEYQKLERAFFEKEINLKK